jgi:outer membrane protein assembly factor BamB
MWPRDPRMTHLSTPASRFLARALAPALLLVLALSAPARAHEEPGVPDWSQFQGSPSHAGILVDGPAPPYQEVWTFRAPEGALSGAVIVDGLAISVGTTAVYAVDLATGAEAWHLPRAGGELSMPAIGTLDGAAVLVYLEGPLERADASTSASATASPSASPSASLSPDAEDQGSELVAVTVADHAELWRLPLVAETRSGVTVDGAAVYVGGWDGTVTAVALDTGTVRWTADVTGHIEAPVASDGTKVYAVARDPDAQTVGIAALDATTGDEAWSYSPSGVVAVASAAAVADGTVAFGAGDRLMRGLSAEDGSVRWAALSQNWFSPVTGPAFQPGNAYFADALGGVYRIDPADGSRDWDHQLNAPIVRSAPVVSGGALVVGLNDGRMAALDPTTGELIWQSAKRSGLVGTISPSHEVIVAVRGGNEAGLVAYEHDPEGTLVRVPSPTVLDPAALLGNFAIATVVVGLVLYVPFRLIRRRVGSPFAEPEPKGDGAVEDDARPVDEPSVDGDEDP